MSKNRKSRNLSPVETSNVSGQTLGQEHVSQVSRSTRAEPRRNRKLPYIGVVLLLLAGGVGAALKYMEEDSRRQNAFRPGDRSMLASVNPWVVQPTPTPTPQLSKEYIYAGSRLLAVEDAGANVAPPADLAVWRPSTGQWWVLGGPNSQQTTYQWGTSGDIPVPGDYS